MNFSSLKSAESSNFCWFCSFLAFCALFLPACLSINWSFDRILVSFNRFLSSVTWYSILRTCRSLFRTYSLKPIWKRKKKMILLFLFLSRNNFFFLPTMRYTKSMHTHMHLHFTHFNCIMSNTKLPKSIGDAWNNFKMSDARLQWSRPRKF